MFVCSNRNRVLTGDRHRFFPPIASVSAANRRYSLSIGFPSTRPICTLVIMTRSIKIQPQDIRTNSVTSSQSQLGTSHLSSIKQTSSIRSTSSTIKKANEARPRLSTRIPPGACRRCVETVCFICPDCDNSWQCYFHWCFIIFGLTLAFGLVVLILYLGDYWS